MKMTEELLKTTDALVCMDGIRELCVVEYLEEDDAVLVLPRHVDDMFIMCVPCALKYVERYPAGWIPIKSSI